MPQSQYESFDRFLFRNPIIPVNHKLRFNKIITDPLFKEAIYLASPDLFTALDEVADNSSKLEGIKISLLKYYLRMKFRCTPFGIFAGCGIGTVGQESKIELHSFEKRTRLDMNLIDNILLDIGSSPELKKNLTYFPNNSLYQIGTKYRYVEYKYKNGHRKYFLSSIDRDEYIDSLLLHAKKGMKIIEMAKVLQDVDASIHLDEAIEFIEELIHNQIIVNNLMPSITGKSADGRDMKSLNLFNGQAHFSQIDTLVEIEALLQNLDSKHLGTSNTDYDKVVSVVDRLGINYNKKYLFQTDLFSKTSHSTLSVKLIDQAKRVLLTLNKLSPKQENQLLKKFKENFYARYEHQEIALTEVLDSDLGIGFGSNTPGTGDNNPLINNFPLSNRQVNPDFTLSPLEVFLTKKFDECIQKKKQEILITDTDLKEFNHDWNDLPLSIYSMIEVLDPQCESETSIIMRYSSGSSAANLMSRFGYLSSDIGEFINEILRKEDELLHKDAVLAEIVHLPEARTGNILARMQTRKYEIPYLAQPSVDEEFVIPITDLMVSVIRGKIRLRSKRLNIEVIPRLTSAHNFSTNALPVYHFLASIQSDGIRPSIGFNWGQFLSSKEFLPRVLYEKAILSPRTWSIKADDFKDQVQGKDRHKFLKGLQRARKLPNKVLLLQGDNKLLIDFNNKDSIDVLIKEARGQSFKIEEYLFNGKKSLITKDNDNYSNQVLLAFYKKYYETT